MNLNALAILSIFLSVTDASNNPPQPPPPPPRFFLGLTNQNGVDIANVVTDQAQHCNAATFFSVPPFGLCFDSAVETAVINGLKTANLDAAHAKLLLHYFAGLHDSEYDPFYAYQDGLSRLGKAINGDNINSFSHDNVLPFIAEFIDPSVLARANIQKLVGKFHPVNHRRQLIKMINKFAATSGSPNAWVKDNAKDILDVVKNSNNWRITDFSPVTLKAIISAPENCDAMDCIVLRDILRSEDHAKIFTNYECLQHIPQLDQYNCDLEIRNLDINLLKKDWRFNTKTCSQYLTTAQVEVLDQDATESPCKGYDLEKSHINGQKLKPTCFAGSLEHRYTPNQLVQLSNEHWAALPNDILSGITEMKAYENFGPTSWKTMPASHKAPMFAKADNCNSLPDGILVNHGNVEISSECFQNLSAANQVDALVNAILKDDALAHATSETVEKWTYNNGNLTKLAVLNAAVERPNIAALIKNMSSKTESTHACASVADFDELKRSTTLQIFGSEECFKQLEKPLQGVGFATLKELESRARAKVNREDLIKGLDDNKFRDMDPDTFGALQRDTTICQIMTASQFGNLPEESVKLVTQKCLSDLTCLGDLSRRQFEPMPVEIFTKADADLISKIKPEAMTMEQFGKAGSELSDLTKHPATKWTADTVQMLDRSYMPHVHPSAWKAAPAASYSGLRSTSFSAIPPENMKDMTAAQLSQAPPEAKRTLTIEQAKEVGKNTSDDMLAVFKDHVAENVKNALANRGKV